MQYILSMNIASTDLNLLKAFAALYAERHVTRAGARIGLAQPSMSNALSRLRALFGDALFVRTPGGMVPTARADALAPQIHAALQLLARALVPAAPFDPAEARAEIAIATSDNLILSHGSAILGRFRSHAPGFDLRLQSMNKDTIWAELDQGQVHIAIGTFRDVPVRFHSSIFAADSFVCIARANHPELTDGLTLAAFARLPHILTTLRGDANGAVDTALDELGVERRIVMTVTQFGALPDLVAKTDCIATMPRSAAMRLAARSGCAIHEPPLALPTWKTRMIWSATTDAEPARRYAVTQLAAVA